MDGFQEILFTFRQNKLRTVLTAFGVFWGILMLVLLLGAGRGMQKGMSEGRFNDMNDCIWIFPNITSVPYKGFGVGREIQFTQSDMAAIRQQFPDVRYMSSENSLGNFINPDTLVSYGLKSGTFNVLGVGDEYFNIKEKIKFNDGRRLDPLDTEDNRKVVVVGTRVSEKLFSSKDSAIGKQIQINGIAFRVVGLFYDKGNRGVMSERIYIPVSTFKRTFGGGETVSLIVVRPKTNADPFALEDKIVALLKQRHHIAPDDTRAMEVSNVARDTADLKSIFNGVTAFIWMVGIGTLFAGVVGVSNIMIITVKERTREIGIRKALGANPRSIVLSLLCESVLVTSVAGYTGLVLGIVILEIISATLTRFNLELAYFQHPEVDLTVAISALLLLVVAGVIAGFVPALRAARIMPIEAMRAE
jgi:putative ABC transport system permease protein